MRYCEKVGGDIAYNFMGSGFAKSTTVGQFFIPFKDGGKRADGRDLIAEMKAKSYTYASTQAELAAVDASKTDRLFGLFTSSHMSYDLDRDPSKEPSLAEMTTKAMDVLSKNSKGYFLMVEGGRIDHALHGTNAKRALADTIAFDDAIKAALDKAKLTDPTLANTLIVVTADHDHTLAFNGYGKRGNPILDINRDYKTGQPSKDADGNIIEAPKTEDTSRSWFSYMTFGLFD